MCFSGVETVALPNRKVCLSRIYILKYYTTGIQKLGGVRMRKKGGGACFLSVKKCCQTTLADMRPSSRLVSLSHLKGSVPAALWPPGTTVAGDKPPCIRAPLPLFFGLFMSNHRGPLY